MIWLLISKCRKARRSQTRFEPKTPRLQGVRTNRFAKWIIPWANKIESHIQKVHSSVLAVAHYSSDLVNFKKK